MGHPAGRNLVVVGERLEGIRFVIRDRDSKFSGSFDEVLRSVGIRIVKTPVRAPRGNAFAERWVRTVRTECLDWMLIWNRQHLAKVLTVYVEHYNSARPHRGINLSVPVPHGEPTPATGTEIERIERIDVLGGLVHEYRHAA